MKSFAMSNSDISYSAWADNPDVGGGILRTLAANLGNDPIRIYEWVRNNIRSEFYYGGERGAYLTYLERAGNDIDQCALLGALLKSANYTPTYRLSWLWVPRVAAAGPNRVGAYEWLGVTDDVGVASVLQNFSPTFDDIPGTVRFLNMWVEVSLPNIGEVKFVPNLKPHTVGRQPSLDALSGYTWSGITGAAGATQTGPYSSPINGNNLRGYLNGLATTASNAVHQSSSLHDLSGPELARLPVLVPQVVTAPALGANRYPDGLQYNDDSILSAYSGIPSGFMGSFELQVGTWSRWFEMSELAGQTLDCQFDTNGAATIRLDAVPIGTESSGNSSQNVTIAIAYEYPVSFLYPNGQPVVVSRQDTIARQNSVAVPYGVGAVQGRLKKVMGDVATKEVASTSNVTATDRLQIIGLQFLSQCNELAALGSASLGHEFSRFICSGFIYLNQNTPVVDFPINICSVYDRNLAAAQSNASTSSAVTLLLGALEGTAIQQTSGSRAFGTPSLFDYAMTTTPGHDAYLVNASNYTSVVGNLQNFNDATLGNGATADVASYIGNGGTILLLGNSNVSYAGVSFGGYYRIHPAGSSSGYVDTMFKGAWGAGSANSIGTGPVGPAVTNEPQTATPTNQTQSRTTTKDPVDLSNGAFLKNDVDLVLDGPGPCGLRMERSYNSATSINDPVGLGRGWTHNYGMKVAVRDPNDLDGVQTSVDEVIPVLLAVRLAQDGIASEGSARAWLIASTAISWAVDQQLSSRADIALGARSIEFIRRPDGSFVAPGGVTADLSINGSNYELAFLHGDTIEFRASDGLFTKVTDQYGNVLTAYYNGSSLSTVTDAYSRTLSFSYSSGRLNQVTDSTGRNVYYGRDANGNFTFTDAEGKMQTLEWNSDFLITRVRDARGRVVVENDYDNWKRVFRQRALGDTTRQTTIGIAPGIGSEVDPLGNAALTYYDARGRKAFVVDQLNHVASWGYDGVDRLVRTVSARGATTSYGYNSAHTLVSVTNPAGDTRMITPDGQNRPWKVFNFEGKETDYTYTTHHDVETITAPGGIVSSFTYTLTGQVDTEHLSTYANGSSNKHYYDGRGYPSQITYPDQTFETFSYDYRGNLTQIVDRNSVKTTYEYNNRRQCTKVTQWQGTNPYAVTQTFYDDAGNVDYVLDASGRKTDYEYDALGHLVSVMRGPIGSQTTVLSNFYDVRSLLSSSADALGHSTAYQYDAADQLVSTTDALNHVTRAGYDADGNLTTTYTPLNAPTTANPSGFPNFTTFDLRGFKDYTTDPENHLVDYGYDKDGRMTSLANRKNQSFTWTYDDVNRITVATTPTGKTTTSTRDTRGLPELVVKPSMQQTSFDLYDAEGRLTQKTDGVGVTTYTYWNNGLPKEVTENGKTTYRGYDSLNRLNEYHDGEGNTFTYEYLPSGELWKLHYPGGQVVTYAYDDFGRLWRVTDWANRVTTYTYDAASRLSRIDRPNGTYCIQEYDNANRLRYIKEFKGSSSLFLCSQLSYDDDGRIVSSFLFPKPAAFTLPGDSMTYDIDNQLSTWKTQSVTFDADGNMINGPLPSGDVLGAYGYDARNRLTSAGGSTYRYNPDGLRVQVTGTGAATYVIDPNAVHSRLLVRTVGSTTTYYVYGLGLIYEDTAGSTKSYHFNQVGSTLALTDDTQNVTDRVGYSPFGTITERTGTTNTPFLFNGAFGVMTDLNGLYYMRARYYNPRLMRFVNADPSGFGGGLNWYAFCGNNPVSNTDPFGLCSKDAIQRSWDFQGMMYLGLWVTKLAYAVPNAVGWMFGAGPAPGYETATDFWFSEAGVDRSSDAGVVLDFGSDLAVALTAAKMGSSSGQTIAAETTAGGMGPVLKGQAGVAQTVSEIEAAGGRVLGREITLDAGGVTVRPDLFVETPAGAQVFVDSKNGFSAGLTQNQVVGYPAIQAGGAIPRGANAAAAGLPVGKPLPPMPVIIDPH
jgi:RHS repeat-associated protein